MLAVYAACTLAQNTRAQYARRTRANNVARVEDIDRALGHLKAAMKPINSRLHKTQYSTAPTVLEAREALLHYSFLLQRERRKLWKMRQQRI